MKIILLSLLIVFSLSLPSSTQQVHAQEPARTPAEKSSLPERSNVPVYGYRIVMTYPHDPGAFTQGLIYGDGYLYEGTGINGRSSLRKVELETGKILKRYNLPEKYFGEGIALCRDRLFQLTYRSNIGFIYDRDFRKVGQFTYPTEGWGLTCDGRRLVMSDGTAVLRWLDSKTFRIIRQITVTDQGRPVAPLNELEMVRGEIFANVWGTDFIARIAPESGKVVGWIDLSGLSKGISAGGEPIDVLNGIACDEEGNRLFITGKFWPKLFEIQLIKK